jgi:hypothetical protein
MANRGWQRAHFTDHPDLHLGPASTNPGAYQSQKAKVMCTKCFEVYLKEARLKDLNAGHEPRADNVIEREGVCSISYYYTPILIY